MNRVGVISVLVMSQILALVVALLGFETLSSNPSGWFLFAVGIVYIAGMGYLYVFHQQRFWEIALDRTEMRGERGGLTGWISGLGMAAAFLLPPLEYVYVPGVLPRTTWLTSLGPVLILCGTALFLWGWGALGRKQSQQVLIQSGPYHYIRFPSFASLFLMALGISLGYSSLAGLISTLAILLPGLVYRIFIEEKILAARFGDAYRQYMQRTKRILPGIW